MMKMTSFALFKLCLGYVRASDVVAVLPDGLDQMPPMEILFVVIRTLVIRVDVCSVVQ